MPPFARRPAKARVDAPVDDQPARDAGAEDDPDDLPVPLHRPRQRLGPRKAIRIIGDADRHAKTGGQIILEGAPVDAGNVRDPRTTADRIEDARDRKRGGGASGRMKGIGQPGDKGRKVCPGGWPVSERFGDTDGRGTRRPDPGSADVEGNPHGLLLAASAPPLQP